MTALIRAIARAALLIAGLALLPGEGPVAVAAPPAGGPPPPYLGAPAGEASAPEAGSPGAVSAARAVPWCGTVPGGGGDELRRHRIHEARHGLAGGTDARRQAAPAGGATGDIGDIAVIEDDGSIIVPPNPFDLARGARLIFRPSGATGFRVTRGARRPLREDGTQLVGFVGGEQGSPTDDGYVEVPFTRGFAFPFYGHTYDRVFVGTNGFLTFGSGDPNSPARVSESSFLDMQPRIAAFWKDLDLTNASVVVRQGRDRCIITWRAAPVFGSAPGASANTFQVKLFSSGRIQILYGDMTDDPDLVGASAGESLATPQPIDLSAPPSSDLTGAPFEAFSDGLAVDRVALARAFYATHGDDYDFLYTMTDFPEAVTYYARYLPVRNDVTGIGSPLFDDSAAWGSGGRLQGVLDLNTLGIYPPNPRAIFIGLNSVVSIFSHEQGHRWGAFVRFQDGDATSTEILGRDLAHWSFYFHTESTTSTPAYRQSSVMEGNAIVPVFGGNFMTAEQQINDYSALDQYLMGMRDPAEVPDTFLIVGTGADPTWNPVSGVTLMGTSRSVGLDDIIAAEGPRNPPASTSQRSFRAAWVLLVQQGTSPSDETMTKIDRFRGALETYFNNALAGRGTMSTALAP